MNENYINHVVLVLDASSSMTPHRNELVRVADGQVQYLARRSQELDQETRVSVYTFADTVRCLIYDKDVLRLPSIKDLYRPQGMTALIDATIKSLDDLSQTATLYGDHAFLAFVLTDGQENASRTRNKTTAIVDKLRQLPANWTVACLVPDQRSVFEAKGFGFQPDNIAIWNATTTAGVIEVGERIQQATNAFMVGRSKGISGTRSLFSTGEDAVNAATVQSTLTEIDPSRYDMLRVDFDSGIRDYATSQGFRYSIGMGYYQLTKTETIQPQKRILIREKQTNHVYGGDAARDMLGLPRGMSVRVKPDANPSYDVFVQSTSTNRKVLKNTDMIVMSR